MQPIFALSFEHDEIALLFRWRGNRWRVAGLVPENSGELHSELESLRRIAIELAPANFSVKIYVERFNVKFESFDAGLTDASQLNDDDMVAMASSHFDFDPALNAFDWIITDSRVQTAVVSRELLAQMESFAKEYRFNPVCFGALCNRNEFNGEPFFGMTSGAQKILGPGAQIDRENEPPRILGASKDWQIVQ